MNVAPLAPADLLTLGGLAIFTSILFKIVELALGLSSTAKARFGPLIAVGIAVVLATAASVLTGNDPFAGFITGVLAGATAAGLYDVATAPVGQ